MAGEGSGGESLPPELPPSYGSEARGDGGKMAGDVRGKLFAGEENEELFSLKFEIFSAVFT